MRHPGRELHFGTLHAITAYPRETLHVTLRNSFPHHLPGEEISALTHGVAYRGGVEEFDCFLRDSIRILEGHESAAAVVQQFNRVPIGSRNDRFACTQCIGQRSGNHLRFVPVRRDVNVGGTNELDHLFRADEAVVEDHLRFDSHVLGQSLQTGSILVPLATEDVRMGRACNDVGHILVFRQNLGQCLNYVFDSLVW